MWQSLLVYNACPQPQTEATVLVSPSLLQIDTFGKWCRCLHNVCYVKLKKRRYLDKCRLSAPAGSSDSQTLWRGKVYKRFLRNEPTLGEGKVIRSCSSHHDHRDHLIQSAPSWDFYGSPLTSKIGNG